MALDIGTRVRIVGRISAAAGHTGTVLLATGAGDGYLVETDEPFQVRTGLAPVRLSTVPRRRTWCAPHELEPVAEPPRPVDGLSRTRRSDPPADLGAARRSFRPALPLPFLSEQPLTV
jgi:hypothetical protein